MAKKQSKQETPTAEINFADFDTIKIKALANAKHLIEDVEYEVTGEIARILITKGAAVQI